MNLTTMKADGRCLALLFLLIAGCAGLDGKQAGDMPQQDAAEAVRLKAVLLEAEDLAGSAIDITIDGGTILLEGFVETDAQRSRAESLIRNHSDHNDISNRITVK